MGVPLQKDCILVPSMLRSFQRPIMHKILITCTPALQGRGAGEIFTSAWNRLHAALLSHSRAAPQRKLGASAAQAEPYIELLKKGYIVDVASIAGGRIPIDPLSLQPPYNKNYNIKRFMADCARMRTAPCHAPSLVPLSLHRSPHDCPPAACSCGPSITPRESVPEIICMVTRCYFLLRRRTGGH